MLFSDCLFPHYRLFAFKEPDQAREYRVIHDTEIVGNEE